MLKIKELEIEKMPTIICSYCHYVGSGASYDERIEDVLNHEETCPERIVDDELNSALQAEAQQHKEWKEKQKIEQLIDEQKQEANESVLHKSRIDWKAGDKAKIKEDWSDGGTGIVFPVLGPAIFSEQWWVPVIDIDDADDPTFFKEAALEKVQ